MRLSSVIVGVVLAVGLSGCDFGRHWVTGPLEDRVLRAESGDRFYLHLEEADGCRWSATSDDSDVEVTIDHRDGSADVEMRVHRGFDGPSMVTFRCRERGKKQPRTFTISFYRRTGDAAFWKK